MKRGPTLHLPRPGEIHLWLLSIPETPPAVYPEAYALLSPEELARNRRYVFEKDRVRDLLTRMLIRQLLGAYLSADPTELQFRSDQYGRPTLVWPDNAPRLDFNLTHAGEMIACGVVGEGRIGIDVEPLHRKVELKLASSFFAKREIDELFSLPPERQPEHFLRLWTLKEAYIKSRGAGMSIPLDSFAFYDFAEDHFRFWEQRRLDDAQTEWSFFSLQPVMEHRIAIAYQSPATASILLRKYRPFGGALFDEISFEVEHSVVLG